MAKCYNCGCEIPDGDRTRLCDSCKRILLPFVKFMDASTSSAVRRLVSNEQNLRHAGVTDGGMDYLFRLCELHDKKRSQEKEARLARQTHADEVPAPPPEAEEPAYSEIELPADEPMQFIRKPYGVYLPAAEILLLVIGAALLVWFVICLVQKHELDVVSMACGVASFFAAYLADILRKVVTDLEEIKKHFR